MFGISMEELLVLAVLAFILFGPQKLPEYAEKLGRLVAKIRAASAEATQQLQNPFQYPPEPNPPEQPDRPDLPRQSAPRSTKRNVCAHCGETLEKDWTFCSNCGYRKKPKPAAARKSPPDTQPEEPRQVTPAKPRQPRKAKQVEPAAPPKQPKPKKPKQPELPVVS